MREDACEYYWLVPLSVCQHLLPLPQQLSKFSKTDKKHSILGFKTRLTRISQGTPFLLDIDRYTQIIRNFVFVC